MNTVLHYRNSTNNRVTMHRLAQNVSATMVAACGFSTICQHSTNLLQLQEAQELHVKNGQKLCRKCFPKGL